MAQDTSSSRQSLEPFPLFRIRGDSALSPDVACLSPDMEAGMARAYSQDLRERVIRTALGGVSVRKAARYGVGISTAVPWVRRARSGGMAARRQGQLGAPSSMRMQPFSST